MRGIDMSGGGPPAPALVLVAMLLCDVARVMPGLTYVDGRGPEGGGG
jgi:hypothetical protein